MKITAKVLEDRTFHNGRFLTLEFPDAPPAPEEHRGSRAPDLPAGTDATDANRGNADFDFAGDDPQR